MSVLVTYALHYASVQTRQKYKTEKFTILVQFKEDEIRHAI